MNDTHPTAASEQLSFWQLITKAKIEIPIIQRDYAQGRADKVKIRNLFLDALCGAIEKSPIELDFVYGSKKSGSLQPLDGQQRLTTLFLLHWYVAKNEGFLDDNVKDILKGFSYETRTSSREFCVELIKEGIVIEKTEQKISEAIKDATWFYLSWEKDPTIKAMLIMLDAIHALFKDKSHVWESLIHEINRPITFQYIELDNFDLTDDLYIKMNARGKQLTPFENFKAEFAKKVADEKWDEGKSVTETFAHQADTTWTDLFWKHKNDDNKLIDKFYIKFIAGITINALALKMDKKEDKEKKIQELFNNPENVSPENVDKDTYDYLYKTFNTYCINGNDALSFSFPFWQYINDTNNSLFSILIKEDKATYPQRVLFFAQTQYLLKQGSFKQDFFYNWMRVVRNIVYNSTIDSADTFIGAINLIDELSKGCDNIYAFLSENPIESVFASKQVKEEIVKAKLMTEESQQVIFDIEDAHFCKGKISFALYCIDYEKTGDTFNSERLSEIHNVLKEYLNNDTVNNKFRRGLLTIRDTYFYNCWWSWVNVVNTNKRCLIENMGDLKNYAYNNDYRHYLKGLLNQLVEKDLDALINQFVPNDTMPNWKKRLIQEPDLLDKYCQSRYIGIPNDESCCYLLRVGRPRNIDSCKKIE